MHETTIGLALLLVAGAMNGSFTLPMKFTRGWEWENTWLVWTIFALFIFPPLLSCATIPGLRQAYAQSSSGTIAIVAGCGFGWGVSQVFFGLANEAVGIALAFALILGIAAVVGALEPLLVYHPDKVLTPAGAGVIGGVVLVLVGVSICAIAGRRRERVLAAAAATPHNPGAKKTSLGRGVLFCVFSGLGSALVNIGLTAGAPLKQAAMSQGASSIWAPNAAWLPLMVAGGIPNAVFCLYLIRKNRTGGKFGQATSFFYVLLAGLMALFWFGSTVLYGVSSTRYLGDLGTVVGWPAFMSLIVITATVWGVLTGEWRNTGKKPLQIQIGGIVVLICAVTLLTWVSSKV